MTTPSADEITPPGDGWGILSCTVWPVYIGLALEGSTPPFTVEEPHNGYERGTIVWTPVPDARQVVGRARITCGPGRYTHFLYFHTPAKPEVCGVVPLAHPIVFTEPINVLDVDPIVNDDLALMKGI